MKGRITILYMFMFGHDNCTNTLKTSTGDNNCYKVIYDQDRIRWNHKRLAYKVKYSFIIQWQTHKIYKKKHKLEYQIKLN